MNCGKFLFLQVQAHCEVVVTLVHTLAPWKGTANALTFNNPVGNEFSASRELLPHNVPAQFNIPLETIPQIIIQTSLFSSFTAGLVHCVFFSIDNVKIKFDQGRKSQWMFERF